MTATVHRLPMVRAIEECRDEAAVTGATPAEVARTRAACCRLLAAVRRGDGRYTRQAQVYAAAATYLTTTQGEHA